MTKVHPATIIGIVCFVLFIGGLITNIAIHYDLYESPAALSSKLETCEREIPRKYNCVLVAVPNIPENEKPVGVLDGVIEPAQTMGKKKQQP